MQLFRYVEREMCIHTRLQIQQMEEHNTEYLLTLLGCRGNVQLKKKSDYRNMAKNIQSKGEIKYAIGASIHTDIQTCIKKQMLTRKITL